MSSSEAIWSKPWESSNPLRGCSLALRSRSFYGRTTNKESSSRSRRRSERFRFHFPPPSWERSPPGSSSRWVCRFRTSSDCAHEFVSFAGNQKHSRASSPISESCRSPTRPMLAPSSSACLPARAPSPACRPPQREAAPHGARRRGRSIRTSASKLSSRWSPSQPAWLSNARGRLRLETRRETSILGNLLRENGFRYPLRLRVLALWR